MRPMPLLVASLLLVWTYAPAASETTPEERTGATLQDFLSAAIEYSPHLGIAAENLNIRAARSAAATRQLLPQISASANVTENRREALNQIDDFRGERYSLQLTQVLFDWKALAARRRAQRIEAQHEAAYAHERSFLLTQVADHYLSALQAQDALESIQAELEAVTSQAAQLQSLFDRQLARITDLRQAQASLASVRAERIALRGELDLAREALQAASGLRAGQLRPLRDDSQTPDLEHDIHHWVQLALENNLQIQAGRLAVQAAEQAASQQKGSFLPEVSLVAQRQNSNVGYDNAPIQRTDISYVGINVSMPLFSGGTRLVGMREARSTHALAENELRQVELDTSERVRRAFLQTQSTDALIEAATALVESVTLTAKAMQQGFALGAVTSVAVLNAIRDRFRAERDLQQVRYDNIRSFLLLKHESGTLTADDLVAVDSWFEQPEP